MNARNLTTITALLLLSVPVLTGCYRQEAPPDPRPAGKKAEADWFNKRAKETNGNFDSLSPEEKMRAIQFSNNSESQARTGFGMAAKYNP